MRKLIVGLTAASMIMSLGPAALAEETVCRGRIGATTVDNLKVPQDATCILEATSVKGTIKVQRNSVLTAIGVRVIGNVQGENARKVVVRGVSSVGGNVQVVQGGRGKVISSRVGGDILFDEQAGRVVVNNSQIGGDLQAFQNSGGVVIQNNLVGGNLQCKANQPAPTGGANLVDGNREDQCEAL
ncbi:MAG TPA: hypothetical protein VFH75_04080 [Actinomycetota bacterium]|nr:hypothetical protein [Actinomycetota bacterium]